MLVDVGEVFVADGAELVGCFGGLDTMLQPMTQQDRFLEGLCNCSTPHGYHQYGGSE